MGTASVEESERISGMLSGIPHRVLNARNDEVEAAIVAEAGQRGAVTISTNMAGRGTDIRLGEGVAALGGLYVIGTNRHESRRIDNQLRGRGGRQGDPGSSRFFVSLEDPLLIKYGDLNPKYRNDPAAVQSLVEGQHLDQRLFFLQSYDSPIEGQRHKIHSYRKDVLEGRTSCGSELERLITLRTIDDLWADYLGRLEDFRAGIPCRLMPRRRPFSCRSIAARLSRPFCGRSTSGFRSWRRRSPKKRRAVWQKPRTATPWDSETAEPCGRT